MPSDNVNLPNAEQVTLRWMCYLGLAMSVFLVCMLNGRDPSAELLVVVAVLLSGLTISAR